MHPRGVCELRELKEQGAISGHADDFAQSMKEVHDQVKRTLVEANQKLKEKVDEGRREVQFQVGDLVMVHLNKARLQKGVPTKLQMRRIGPCKILEKYGQNAYKVDLPNDLNISPIFNVQDLIVYRGPEMTESTQKIEIDRDVRNIKIQPQPKLQAERILDSRVKKTTRRRVYREYLVQWRGLPVAEATWLDEEEFRKKGISSALLLTNHN